MSPLMALANLFGILFTAIVVAALTTWAERRLLALWQDRYGPNRVGPFGLLQVVADMVKMLAKDDWVPAFADRGVFILAPAVVMVAGLMAFAVIPFAPGVEVVDLDIGLLFVLAMTSLAVYSAILAGWAANNKYALLGSLRASAQSISYEVFMGIALMGVVLQAGSFNLREIVAAQEGLWFCIPQGVGMVLFLIAGLVETHRVPFDIPLAETELVAGYHTEYSGLKFGLFYIGEYLGVLLVSTLVTALYLGGWLGPLLPPLLWFALKTLLVMAFIILLRAALPRPRYDQLMAFGWKVMLPLALVNLMVTGAAVVAGGV